MENKNLALKRWQKAIFITKILSAIPFVRFIAVNGSMVFWERLKESSDIDFLIVTKKNRLYTVRFLASTILFLIRMKRHGRHIAGRACLNRYVTEENLEMQPHHYYYAQVFSAVVPVFDKNNLYPEFQKANRWMEREFNFKVEVSPFLKETFNLPITQPEIASQVQNFLEKILRKRLGDFIETLLFAIQKIEVFLKKRKDTQKGVVRVFNKNGAFYYLGDKFLAEREK
jgi:hypothetical protein